MKEYIKKRRLDEVIISEDSEGGINTNVSEIAQQMVSDEIVSPDNITSRMETLMGGIGDAAVLMAADGYGSAKVEGKEAGKTVIIRTSENQKSFSFKKDPDPKELLKLAHDEFKKINDKRYLKH